MLVPQVGIGPTTYPLPRELAKFKFNLNRENPYFVHRNGA